MKYTRAIELAQKRHKQNECNCICRKNVIHFQKQLFPSRIAKSKSQGVGSFWASSVF